jgi:hypothetical protein
MRGMNRDCWCIVPSQVAMRLANVDSNRPADAGQKRASEELSRTGTGALAKVDSLHLGEDRGDEGAADGVVGLDVERLCGWI